MPRERKSAGDRINLPKTKADDYFDAIEVKSHDLSTSQPANQPNDKQGSQDAGKSTSQQVDKLQKATFKLSRSVLEHLDTLHLQLQLQLGKAHAPYKEVIVEEAISQLLEQMQKDRDSLISRLQERQHQSRS